MKKFFTLFLTLMTSVMLWAYDFQSGDLCYNITSDVEPYTVEVTSKYFDAPFNKGVTYTSVTIPSSVTYNGITYAVTGIGSRAFIECYSLTSVTIPNSVTSIGEFAFEYCSSLTSVTIPNSVTSIGDNAFDYCSSLPVENNLRYADTYLVEAVDKTLSTYSIKEGTKWIGNDAFRNCSSLTSITIPNSVTSIGWSAFYRCSALTSVTIGNNVEIIDWYAFCNCSSLTSITIPNSVTRIKNQAFQGCSSLTSVTIGNNVTLIDNIAFFECSSLDTLRILATTPPTLRDEVFSRTPSPICYIPCGTKSAYEVSDWAQYVSEFVEELCEEYTITYTSTDGNIVHPRYDTGYSTNGFGANLLSNTYENGVGKMIFDAPVTSIGGAYFWRSNLTSIVIPSTVTTIERNAFYESYDLTSVSLAEGLVNINEHAFSFCRSLTTITIPNSVTYLGENVFGECYGLSSISIGSGITNINERVFQDCDALDTIYIKAVTPPIIDKYAFFDTHASICYIPCGTLGAYQTSDWGNYVDDFIEECKTNQIYYTSTDGNIVIPNKADAFGANIVSNTYENGVGTITFDGPITSIGSNAFSECSSLTSIIIPNSVTTISNNAFDGCFSLESVVIPEGVKSLGSHVFSDCTNLRSLIIPKSATSIGADSYPLAVRVPNLMSIRVVEGNPVYDSRNNCNAIIETATDRLLLGCQSTVIPNNIKRIEKGAFLGAKMLTSIDIPASVDSIGYAAFANTGIIRIAIPAGTVIENTPYNHYSTNPYSGDLTATGVFSACRQLTEVVLPDGMTYIPNYVFSLCSSLQSVVIPNSVVTINGNAFSDCISLTTITIPENVSSIERCAFENCSALTNVYVKATTPPALDLLYDTNVFTSSPVCHIPCGTKAAYEASAWASQVSEFVEDCDNGSYSRNVRIGYNTICLPHGSSNFTGATFYEIAHILKNKKKIFFDEVKTLEAGKPYIFYPHSNEVTVYYDNTTSAIPLSHNGLHGTFDGITAASNFLKGKYLVAGDRMVLCGDGCSLAANRAYIELDEISDKDHPAIPGIKRVSMDYSEENATTALDNITDESIIAPIQEGVYDILGRKVDAPTVSGFYIINGKKVFVAL